MLGKERTLRAGHVGPPARTGFRPCLGARRDGEGTGGAPRLAVVVAALLGLIAEGRSQELAAGPLAQEFRLTLDAGARAEAFGPLLSWQRTLETTTWGIHPLLSGTSYDADASEFDLLYPLLTYDRFGPEARWQLFQVLSFATGERQDGRTIDRTTLFPFYFRQRSSDGSDDYAAVFPFYGRLRQRFWRDEVFFAAWPLYTVTRKGGKLVPPAEGEAPGPLKLEGGYTTYNYLVPLVHVREGEGLRGWQVWPLAGYEEQAPLTRTNTWGELEVVSGYRKSMALWPIYFDEKTQLGTENPQHQRAVLPLFSSLRSPDRDSFTAPWPIGLTVTDDRAKGYREWGFPWPLMVIARGEGKTADRIWPFYSRVEMGDSSSGFLLWPLYKVKRAKAAPLERERHQVLFYLYSDLTERNTETGEVARRTDLWPLFTARQRADGSRRLQLLAPIEPILPNHKSVERNWSPVWSLWRSEANAVTGQRSVSVLWNLYRRDVEGASRKGSLLFGLFQYQSSPEGKRWRVFGVPFGHRPAAPPRPSS